ncbi:MAG: coenzyme F420-0:L-glutamate ligase [Candidatus Helarchaeota archaeon]
MNIINIIAISGIPKIKEGDDIGAVILDALDKNKLDIKENDIIIIAQTIISKSEGRIVKLDKITPSEFAYSLALKVGKDPRLIEIILRESSSLIKIGNGKIITESKLGFICADAGVDHSNSPPGTVTLMPLSPDKTAEKIKRVFKEKKGVNVAVIITDTHGRPFREGAINVAIGVAGLEPILDYWGKVDIYGNRLLTTKVAVADEIASAAELFMGEANESIPVVIIRGYKYQHSEEKNLSRKLIRDENSDLFR